MLHLLGKLFKPKKDKDIALLQPRLAAIHAAEAQLKGLTDDQLRGKTASFQATIAERLAEFDSAEAEQHAALEALRAEGEVEGQEAIFARLDSLKVERNQALEKVLAELLPEAFAVVRETCRRLSLNGKLVVAATDWDRTYAETHPHVTIDGTTAVWDATWEVKGNPLTWNMVHYDVQLLGGIVLHEGRIAEMATGEGKTLVSTLPVYLNALAGRGVHMVTVNDYLATRDAEWNGPIFAFHGLRVDCIDLHQPNTEDRRQAYLSDITYGTNNEFGFDYLRDNMVTHPDHLVQRAHHFAIVDEVDSVLIDEARTPLIISGPVPQGDRDREEFVRLKPRVERVVNLQRRYANECLTAARRDLAKDDKESRESGGMALLRAHRGLPKYGPLIKFLSEEGMRVQLQKTEAFYMQDQSKNMWKVDQELYFTIDEKNNQIELTDKGREALTDPAEDPNLWVLPDLGQELYAIDQRTDLDSDAKLLAKEKITREFADKSERLHNLTQLLKAYTLFERDVEYIVQDGKVMIVDENTGRVLAGRRYSDGLHQAIEAKENVRVEAATQTFATITLQNYFRMYHKLAGMTGTAETEAGEFWQIYKLDVVVVPTNRPVVRQDADDLVYKTKREKYNAIIDEIVKLTEAGRPVLVGTTSVDTSELISKMLRLRKINHNVLNAKYHEREAEIVAEAGKAGAVTIATNMAGRGTDIKLGPGVKEAGGLAIIGSERHESRRIDRQLRGRAGRQGDPGSSTFFVSLEDDLMRLFNSERIAKVMDWLKIKEGEVIQDRLITRSISNAQKKVEENHFGTRKRLLEYDDVMNAQREAIYKRRRNALFGDRLQLDLRNMRNDFATTVAERFAADADTEALRLDCIRTLAIDPELSDAELSGLKPADLAAQIAHAAHERYRHKLRHLTENLLAEVRRIRAQNPQYTLIEVPMTEGTRGVRLLLDMEELLRTEGRSLVDQFEKTVTLGVIDENWKEHLRAMDELKQNVQTAYLEQKDPLLVYKFEAFELFQAMLAELNGEVLSVLYRAEVERPDAAQRPAPPPRRDDFSKLKSQHGGEAPARRTPVSVGTPDGGERKLSRRERRANERKKK